MEPRPQAIQLASNWLSEALAQADVDLWRQIKLADHAERVKLLAQIDALRQFEQQFSIILTKVTRGDTSDS